MSTTYSEEFKKDAVALVESGSTQRQVCHDLGVSKSALSKWVKDSALRARGIEPAGDVDERRGQTVLLYRIEELEIENEILRKASAYLSQANLARPK
jgi:transposase